MPRLASFCVVAMLLCGVVAIRATAEQPWTPPAPTNLQVLPKASSSRDLIGTMRGFTRALGVRCQHCHVYKGDDPDDLAAYDFASDDRDAKRTARAMLRMTLAINADHLKGIGDQASAAPKVTCYTCHRGEKQPLTDRPDKR